MSDRSFKHRLKQWVARMILRVALWYFRNRQAHLVTQHQGTIIHLGTGRFTGGKLVFDKTGDLIGVTILYVERGYQLGNAKRVSLLSVRAVRGLGWCVFE